MFYGNNIAQTESSVDRGRQILMITLELFSLSSNAKTKVLNQEANVAPALLI